MLVDDSGCVRGGESCCLRQRSGVELMKREQESLLGRGQGMTGEVLLVQVFA